MNKASCRELTRNNNNQSIIKTTRSPHPNDSSLLNIRTTYLLITLISHTRNLFIVHTTNLVIFLSSKAFTASTTNQPIFRTAIPTTSHILSESGVQPIGRNNQCHQASDTAPGATNRTNRRHNLCIPIVTQGHLQ